MTCAKSGVSVFKASMLDWRGSICHRYMCIVYIYIDAMRYVKCGVSVFRASMLNCLGGFHLPWVYVHCLYIYRSAMRCAKFGVAVFKASMLNCLGSSICHRYMCIVHIYI